MYCKYCGKKLEDGVSFCTGCGKPVQGQPGNKKQEQSEKKHYPKKKKTTKKAAGVLVTAAVVLAVVGAGGVYKIYTEKSGTDRLGDSMSAEAKRTEALADAEARAKVSGQLK